MLIEETNMHTEKNIYQKIFRPAHLHLKGSHDLRFPFLACLEVSMAKYKGNKTPRSVLVLESNAAMNHEPVHLQADMHLH